MPRIGAQARVHRLTLGSDSHAVRFLSAIAAATHGKLLMALDCDGGEPRRNRTFNPQIKRHLSMSITPDQTRIYRADADSSCRICRHSRSSQDEPQQATNPSRCRNFRWFDLWRPARHSGCSAVALRNRENCSD